MGIKPYELDLGQNDIYCNAVCDPITEFCQSFDFDLHEGFLGISEDTIGHTGSAYELEQDKTGFEAQHKEFCYSIDSKNGYPLASEESEMTWEMIPDSPVCQSWMGI
ncbi:hypothetical protein SLS53_008624 [Cytospora paraplurivora]|uniref:Uncharacterized protein n=1 Tax=Cytospora paraplurivora TaxID=2898453 RepID=A0AAN9TYL6_9PEZI